MKTGFCLVMVLGSMGVAGVGMAQEAGVPAGVPPARVGFQMALRTGYAIPMGDATGAPGAEMSDTYSGQVPLFIEIGGKVIPNLFIGGYLGFAFGGTAGELGDICDQPAVDCVAVGVRLGVEAQYHILPAGKVNPWVGYGFGFESIAIGISDGNDEGSVSNSGFEYAHFMGGVDFRLSRVVGLGPFVDFSVGEYTRYEIDLPGFAAEEGDVENTAIHEWLTLGLRVVFFP